MYVLSDKQTNILLALAQFKFLAVSQFKALGIDKHNSNLRTALKPLLESNRQLIDRIMFSMYPKANDLQKKNKLEYIYYLKPKGKQYLVDNLLMQEEDIRLPKGNSSFAYKDYYHRKSTINCHIALCQVARKENVEVLFFDTYFDKIGNNRTDHNLRAKTRITISKEKYLIADAIFMIHTPLQKELYCLEIQNGKDTALIIRKLKEQYIPALHLGSPSELYNFERGNRVLIIFEHTSTMKATTERLSKDIAFTHMHKYFLFKSLDELDNFFTDWIMINGEHAYVF